MSNDGRPQVYIVAAWFADGATGIHLVGTWVGVCDYDAMAKFVASYYMQGGKLPLVSTSAHMIDETQVREALALYEQNTAQAKTEAAKVVSLVPVDPTPLIVSTPGQPLDLTPTPRGEPPTDA